MTEYQSQEDRAHRQPVRPRIDEVTGLPLYRGTFADPSAEKEREVARRKTPAAYEGSVTSARTVCHYRGKENSSQTVHGPQGAMPLT